MNQDQLADLAWLLANTRTVGDIFRVADRVVGSKVSEEAANDIKDIQLVASKMVAAIQKANRIPDAVDLLLAEGHPSGPMAVGLRRILSGERLNSDAALQALINEHEPFLSSADMIDLLPKVARRICAVALGTPYNKIRGSGFLIAPDIVITNYHVVEEFIDETTGEFKQKEPGDQLFFFFDYLRAPTPKVPPGTGHHGTVCVTAATEWLVLARKKLLNDGTQQGPKEIKNNELDYALIKLARPVGSLSAQTGGLVRGWLPLEDFIDVENPQKRILVVQHPEALPQLFDIGDYEGMDPTETRVRYSVSTAHGSSGGAAIGTDGRLFALHNAEVKGPKENFGAKRVNQGVRIDLIAKDIGTKIPRTAMPSETTLLWSLNDNFQNSLPIIGRSKFRDFVTQMNMSNSERVLVVTGTPPLGLQFSIKLLLRMRVPDARVAVISAPDLRKDILEGFVPRFVTELNIGSRAGQRPEPRPTEGENRWVRDVGNWLAEAIARDQETNRTKYPAWIVINTIVSQYESFAWGQHLEDLISTLLGRRNDERPALDLPQLRWLFLATPSTNLPLAGISRFEENLDNDNTLEKDFEECYLNAYRSIDRQGAIPRDFLRPFARVFLDQVAQIEKPTIPRKALADYVKQLLKNAPATQGE
jgi:hypothetical protein